MLSPLTVKVLLFLDQWVYLPLQHPIPFQINPQHTTPNRCSVRDFPMVPLRVFGVSQGYQWYTNIVQGFTNGNAICSNGNANGIIGSPNCTIGANVKPVKLSMVPLGQPRTEPLVILPIVPLVANGTILAYQWYHLHYQWYQWFYQWYHW